jgi:lipopolysaccharide/colanic/teichoic acid biosynthesis glycosyltransferase
MPREAYRWSKRVFDVVAAVILTIALLPLAVAVAVAIKLTSRGRVIFRQERIGEGGRTFEMLKFRTMREPRHDEARELTDGKRMTTFGRFLRRASLDELPQLWNVIRGDLSLVGPRPLPVKYMPYFTAREQLRYSVPPGITGWAQIQGRNESGWTARFANDVWYVENRSFMLDICIIWMTVTTVIRKTGLVDDPRSVMLNLDEERAGLLVRGDAPR